MDNKFFTMIKPYLNLIDSGEIYRNPFKWLYMLIAAALLLFPFYIMYNAIDMNLFQAPGKIVAIFLLTWVIFAGVCWIGFQIWWNRKDNVSSVAKSDDMFVAIPYVCHFIETAGEFIGIAVAILGITGALLTTIFGTDGAHIMPGGDYSEYGIFGVVIFPIVGFLMFVFSRFVAEQIKALAAIANNTKK